MTRHVIVVEYDGTNYAGWQRQSGFSNTVQETLETALSQVANQPITLVCAGRTDAGVHALGQVAHFDSTAERAQHSWVLGTNHFLPTSIRVQTMVTVREDFHARYDAHKRHYRYLILQGRQPSALWYLRQHWHPRNLDAAIMHESAQILVGEHDFSAFRAAECQSKTPYRFIESITVSTQSSWVIIDIIGNAFLHHMVRNIVGSLLMVGDGRRTATWFASVFKSRDRTCAGPTAPAYGLYLYRVYYSAKDAIPEPVLSDMLIG